MTAALWLLLTACGPRERVEWTLPDHGVVVVNERNQTITRTPLGMEEVTVDKRFVWRVQKGGTIGEDEVVWREEVGSWQIAYNDLGGNYVWTMGEGQPLAEALLMLGPTQPREVHISATGEVSIVQLDPPAPEEPEEPEPTRRRRRSDPPPPAPVPWQRNGRIQTWVLGFTHAPRKAIGRGTDWSWGASSEVMRRTSSTSTTTRWQVASIESGMATLRESMQLEDSMPPSAGYFQTTALAGGADIRVSTDRDRLMSYTARYEADIASPSARGTAVRVYEVTLEVQ